MLFLVVQWVKNSLLKCLNNKDKNRNKMQFIYIYMLEFINVKITNIFYTQSRLDCLRDVVYCYIYILPWHWYFIDKYFDVSGQASPKMDVFASTSHLSLLKHTLMTFDLTPFVEQFVFLFLLSGHIDWSLRP